MSWRGSYTRVFAFPGFDLPGFDLGAFVTATLAEDLGEGLPGGGRDVTSESVIPANARFSGVMDSRDAIVVCGLPLAAAFFRALDPDMQIDILAEEGVQVPAGSDLMRLEGNARAMLTAERSALNTVQHLSGIATMTRGYVDAMAGNATLLDTRKTIPGLRHLEKYATRTGGARNHRMGLWDAARSTGSTRSNPRWAPGRRTCCSTTWVRRCWQKPWRWSRAGCRARHRAECGSIPSPRSPPAGSITSRSAA